MRVVIIEDEIAALTQLRGLLESNPMGGEIEIVETMESIAESIEFFRSDRSHEVDLVFMDIHLSDGYAFSIFKHVEVALPIIFTTAYDEYALQSFQVNCIDYVLKPLSTKDIERIFAKIKMISQYSTALVVEEKKLERLLVIDRWRTVPLQVADVAYFYKEGNKVKAYDRSGKAFLTNMTLERLEEQLDGSLFIRANRQFIVARTAIQDLESYEGSRALLNLHQSTPEPVVISRTKVTAFKRWIISK